MLAFGCRQLLLLACSVKTSNLDLRADDMVNDQFIFGVGLAVTLLTAIGVILSLFVDFLKRTERDTKTSDDK